MDFQCAVDADSNAVKVEVVADDGSKADFQFEFDPRSGRYDWAERDELEAVVGADFVERLEAHVRKLIGEAVLARRRAERDDFWGA
jgi:hypothetical protein